MKGRKVVIVGAGVMGKILANKLATDYPNWQICLTLRNRAKIRQVKKEVVSGVQILQDNECIVEADIVFLAIKPRDREKFFSEYGKKMKPEALLISIMAGVSLTELGDKMHSRVVRCMTNTAVQTGQAVSVWQARSAGVRNLQLAKEIFLAWGKEFHVDSEGDIDKATALFGSGPALVYAFVENLYEAGLLIGFPKSRLAELVQQMVVGAMAVAQNQPGVHFAELRDGVSSSGGTTVEGLAVLDEKGFSSTLKCAVRAMHRKCTQLL